MSAHGQSLPYDLKGHTAIVTGANHGIGAATGRLRRPAQILPPICDLAHSSARSPTLIPENAAVITPMIVNARPLMRTV